VGVVCPLKAGQQTFVVGLSLKPGRGWTLSVDLRGGGDLCSGDSLIPLVGEQIRTGAEYVISIAGKAASDTEETLLDSLGDAGSTPFFPKAARPNQRYSTASYAGLWSESETADRVWPNPYPDEDGA
jgi:hypothetical protein